MAKKAKIGANKKRMEMVARNLFFQVISSRHDQELGTIAGALRAVLRVPYTSREAQEASTIGR